MKSLLIVHSSPANESSSTRKVVAALVARLLRANPGLAVVERDLARSPVPHFGFEPEAIERSDSLCREFMAADIIVVGAPMWNFSIPSVLKAWVDHLVRAGVTFQYTANGPKGLVPPGKKLFIVEASGGVYADTPAAFLNHVGPYLVQIFGFLGVVETEVIRVGGTATRKDEAEREALTTVSNLQMGEMKS